MCASSAGEKTRCDVVERAAVTPPTESVQPGSIRQAAIERVNDPEQLDRLLTVTSARGWIALTAVAGLIGVAVGWSLVGRLPSYVEGQGAFIREGGSIAPAAA